MHAFHVAANGQEAHVVPVRVGQGHDHFVGLVAGAAADSELQALAGVDQILCAGHGKKAIAAKLGKDGLGGGQDARTIGAML